jgi:hypothetical protein
MSRMEKTPEQRYERLRETVQQTILRNFPNPGRKGCPANRVIQEVAGRRELIEDDAWQHITHCSPCYASFLQSKNEFRALRRRRGLGALAAGIAAIVVASAVTVYELNHLREQASIHGEETYEAAALDLKESSPLRGPEVGPGNPVSRFLPNKKLDLAIYLPFGSEPGKYEIQLRKAGQALVTVEANAVLKQGRTDLHVKIDLSKYPPGGYLVALRQPPWSWRENPATLR